MRFVVFFIGEQQYGIEIGKLKLIAESSRTEQISPRLISAAGETIPLCDLHSLLGAKPSVENKAFFVVTSSNDEKAFAVDKINGLFVIPADDIKPCRPMAEHSCRLFSGIVQLENETVLLLDTDMLNV